MASQPISEYLGPIFSQLGTFTLGVVTVSLVSFALARAIGGSSRPKRRVVFYISSVIGFACVILCMSTRVSSH